MFGIFKSRHHGRHKHPIKQLKIHRAAGRHGQGRHHGHGHGHKHARWHRFGPEAGTSYDTAGSLSIGIPPAKPQVDETSLAAATATCPLCENHCLLDDPGCGKGEAYALSLAPA